MTTPEHGTDAASLRRAFGCFPLGVTAVCGLVDGVPVGMAASSFTSVSLDPPLASVCVQLTSTTWPRLRALPRLGVTVLAEHHGPAATALAATGIDRFAGVEYECRADGTVFLPDAGAHLSCSLHAELPAGDHRIALLRIHGIRADPDTPPLVFHGGRFRALARLPDRPPGIKPGRSRN